MKAYLVTTGIIFALITLAHLVRIGMEWPHLLAEPDFVLLTFLSAGLSVWAWRLLRRKSGPT